MSSSGDSPETKPLPPPPPVNNSIVGSSSSSGVALAGVAGIPVNDSGGAKASATLTCENIPSLANSKDPPLPSHHQAEPPAIMSGKQQLQFASTQSTVYVNPIPMDPATATTSYSNSIPAAGVTGQTTTLVSALAHPTAPLVGHIAAAAAVRTPARGVAAPAGPTLLRGTVVVPPLPSSTGAYPQLPYAAPVTRSLSPLTSTVQSLMPSPELARAFDVKSSSSHLGQLKQEVVRPVVTMAMPKTVVQGLVTGDVPKPLVITTTTAVTPSTAGSSVVAPPPPQMLMAPVQSAGSSQVAAAAAMVAAATGSVPIAKVQPRPGRPALTAFMAAAPSTAAPTPPSTETTSNILFHTSSSAAPPSQLPQHRGSPGPALVTGTSFVGPVTTISEVGGPPRPAQPPQVLPYPAQLGFSPYLPRESIGYPTGVHLHHSFPGGGHPFPTLTTGGGGVTLRTTAGGLNHSQGTTMATLPTLAAPPSLLQNQVLMMNTTSTAAATRHLPVPNLEGNADSMYATLSSAATSLSGSSSATSPPHQQQLPSAALNATSPRPSILRKRNTERKPQVLGGSQPGSPKADYIIRSAPSSPKPSESTQSNDGGSTTDSVGSQTSIKQELGEAGPSNGTFDLSASATSMVTIGTVTPEASPRKKPRKQQHVVATEHEEVVEEKASSAAAAATATPSTVRVKAPSSSRPQRSSAAAAESKAEKKESKREKSSFVVRPHSSLIDSYRTAWNPSQNHFQRYSDIRVKDERKSTVQELSTQKGVSQKTSGWKIHHMSLQLDDLIDLEREVFDQMKEVRESLKPGQISNGEDVHNLYELVQGNVQRSQLAVEQLSEAKSSMMKLMDHKPKVNKIINKHVGKRNAKKKHSIP